MKLIGTLCVAALCSVVVGAQSNTRVYKNETEKNKAEVKKTVEVKGGKEIKAVGCLIANPAGGGYLLTNIGKTNARYALVTDDNMSQYLDHRVEVTGKATNQGNGEVRLQTTTKLDNRENVGTAGQTETKTTTEAKGKIAMRFLGVDSVRTVSNSCAKS